MKFLVAIILVIGNGTFGSTHHPVFSCGKTPRRSHASAFLSPFVPRRWGGIAKELMRTRKSRLWLYDERPRETGSKYPISEIRRTVDKARTVDEIESYMETLFSISHQDPFSGLSPREETELVRLLGKRNAYDSMLSFLPFSRRKTSTYTAAMSALSKSRNSTLRSRALKLLDEMDDIGVKPTSYTFAALFSSIDGALATTKLLERIRQYDSTDVLHVYNAAILACSRVPSSERSQVNRDPSTSWQTALNIYFEMRKAGIAPNLQSYGSLLHVCAQSGQVRIALSLLEEMRNRGLKPNAKVWGAALNVCAKAGDCHEATRLMSEMQRDGVNPNTRHLSSLLSALAKVGQDEMAMEILEGMQQSKEMTLYLNDTLLQLRPAPPNIVAINTVLKAFANTGNYEGAKMLLERMKLGEYFSIDGYGNHQPGSGVSSPDQNNVIYPDAISYNTVLSACRDSREAKCLVKEVSTNILVP